MKRFVCPADNLSASRRTPDVWPSSTRASDRASPHRAGRIDVGSRDADGADRACPPRIVTVKTSARWDHGRQPSGSDRVSCVRSRTCRCSFEPGNLRGARASRRGIARTPHGRRNEKELGPS
jgi:hypothetical protein